MSIRIAIEDLADEVPKWGAGYLLTGNEHPGRPHLLALRPTLVGGLLRLGAGGGRACRNAAARPEVTVLFPPYAGSDGFSLVIDGIATVDGDVIDVLPTTALLHRPAP